MEANGIFESAMNGRWDQVVEAYKKNPSLEDGRITRSRNTAVHIAVSDGRTEVVSKLVEIFGDNASRVLHIKNEKGNTPLHLAAKLGDAKMCYCLATRDRSLIRTRNSEGETPLFLSALHGKKNAFLCLHFLYREAHKENDYSLCRKSNGDTILHSAISGEYFSLAFQIIHNYPNLVTSVNESGLSPLHILASKPNAFRSGCHLPPFSRLIYCCLIVHEIQQETHNPEVWLSNSGNETGPKYPQNYQTCMSFFSAIKRFFQILTRTEEESICHQVRQFLLRVKGENDKLKDEENAQEISGLSYDRNLQEKEEKRRFYPPNYETSIQLFKFMANALLVILGFGSSRIKNVRAKKERHIWATQLLNELVQRASSYTYENDGRNPRNSWPKRDGDPSEFLAAPHISEVDKLTQSKEHIGLSCPTTNQEIRRENHGRAAKLGVAEVVNESLDAYPTAVQELNTSQKNLVLLAFEKKETQKFRKKETPILVAAKVGITEIVDKILDTYPLAIQDLDSDEKNAVLLAVEHRQTDVYNLLLKRAMVKESVFRQLDKHGNSALHLAAKLGDYRPKLVPGAALQMQWEIKWYKFVKNSMPPHFFVKHNSKGQTPKEIFIVTHKELVAKGSEWLTKTSESCSVVAALVATVAFATSATIPGGVNPENGAPILENEPAFEVFAIASLVALCFSVTAVIFFLTILTSRYQENDFAMDLPRKLFLGLTSLFTSIASILLSFCAGHFFVLKESLRTAAYPLYAATCLPISFFALSQLPLYFDLGRAILLDEPQRSYKHKVS
ncbi:uncharacterized protein LOC8280664 isoform X1 [Ricinus communis]|uniref:uncharacterized protein LOC8280664 isoform X1 n=1 Tax=Ricinus communis TaxID=3988 RepID=UPI00201A6D97|nr:uncharacterized protein LOC8280664 isoform X1 [Ricinus communis]